MNDLKFGYKCKDIVTNFIGILSHRSTHITGCDRLTLINEEQKEQTFEAPIVEKLDDGIYPKIKGKDGLNCIEDIENAIHSFGEEAKDKITGFQGRIVAKCISISGEIAYALSPEYSHTNRENKSMWVDESRIEIVNKEKIEIEVNEKRVGGVPNVPKDMVVR